MRGLGYKEDQKCTACQTVFTAKELNRGASGVQEVIVIGRLDRVERHKLCVPCQVSLNRALSGKAQL